MSKILIGKYQATIYQEGDGYTGAISLGFDGQGKRQRIKRRGRTKAAVKDKLIEAVADRDAGLQPAERYTVADAVKDWLAKGLKGRDENTIGDDGRDWGREAGAGWCPPPPDGARRWWW
jgi:hypothetical protein